MTRAVLFGSGPFARAVAERLTADGHAVVAAVTPAARRLPGIAAPAADAGDRDPDPLRGWADRAGALWLDAATYAGPAPLPPADLIIAAHSHNFLGRRTRAHATYAVGYHPSLLPVHRGRDAIRWTVRDGDRITGGTVYHLTDAVDAGPIAAAQHVIVPPNSTPRTLWRDLLLPLGVHLVAQVAADADRGTVGYTPQAEESATWEPSWHRPPLHRPELPELGGPAMTAARGVWAP